MAIQTQPKTAEPFRQRYGCFPMRIGASFNHKLERDLTLKDSHRLLRKGISLHLDVQDITRRPDLVPHTKWVCRNAECKGESWASKEALVAAHDNNRQLEVREEAHCYYGVAWTPAVAARPVKLDKDNSVVEEAIEASPPVIVLLSDED